MKGNPPIEMLKACRRRFIDIRDWETSMGTKLEDKAAKYGANRRAQEAQKYIDRIDDTLRDWA